MGYGRGDRPTERGSYHVPKHTKTWCYYTGEVMPGATDSTPPPFDFLEVCDRIICWKRPLGPLVRVHYNMMQTGCSALTPPCC